HQGPVNHADFIGLLKGGIPERGGRWAELGAGEGNFTLALAELLGPGAHVTAVDRDRSALAVLASRMPDVEVVTADFSKPIGLSDLDGVVMANSLHFVRDKKPVLEAVTRMLKPG